MTTLPQIIEILQRLQPLLADRFHVESIGMFGSYVRSEQRPDSDLDILVSFRETPGLVKFIELENFLSDSLIFHPNIRFAERIEKLGNCAKYSFPGSYFQQLIELIRFSGIRLYNNRRAAGCALMLPTFHRR